MIVRTAVLFVASAGAENSPEEVAGLVALLRQTMPSLLLVQQQSITSQRHWIEETLRRWCDEDEIDLILTVGGTFPAPGPQDAEIVPEATQTILERLTPSLPETMRAVALEETPTAILDRGVAGIRGRTLLINLPSGMDLAQLFLQSVVDLLPLFIERLQTDFVPDASAAESSSDPKPARKLDQAEFAKFLRQRGKSSA